MKAVKDTATVTLAGRTQDVSVSFGKIGVGVQSTETNFKALSSLLASLETTPAKKLAWTLRNYGAYIVDLLGNKSGGDRIF